MLECFPVLSSCYQCVWIETLEVWSLDTPQAVFFCSLEDAEGTEEAPRNELFQNSILKNP